MTVLKTTLAMLLSIALCVPNSALAADEKLVIIPLDDAGSSRMTKPLLKQVVQPMGAAHTLVAYGQYRRAAKKAKIDLAKLAEKNAVEQIAKSLGITHLVTVQVKRADKKSLTLVATLIDVNTPSTSQSWEIKQNGATLNTDTGKSLVKNIAEGLKAKPKEEPAPVVAAATPAATPAAAAAPTVANAAPAKTPDAPEAMQPAPATAAAATPETASIEPALAPLANTEAATAKSTATAAPETAVAATPSDAKPAEPKSAPETVGADDKASKSATKEVYYGEKRQRDSIYVALGFAGVSRNAKLNDSGDAVNSVQGATGGFVPSIAMDLEAFPLAYLNQGPWWAQVLGVHIEAVWSAKVEWAVNGSSFENSFSELRMGVSYRYVLWEDKSAPHITFRGGIAKLAYPNGSSFPGARYSATYVGLAGEYELPIEVPMLDSVALQGNLDYYLSPSAEGGLSQLGILQDSAGMRANGAAILKMGEYYVKLKASFQNTALKYQGPYTSADGKTYHNPEFSESVMSGQLLGGVTF